MVPSNFFSGKKVLVTGHTGFKGSWLCKWLDILEADIVGISDKTPTSPCLYDQLTLNNIISDNRFDIRDETATLMSIINESPDIVLHLAAQPLVRKSLSSPHLTWSTNVIGALNVLEGCRQLDKPLIVVIITSDKCYENNNWVWGYRENDKLGGKDPYSGSKAAVEILANSYFRSFFQKGKVKITTVRAGNVIGGGDWSEDRLIPDCIRSWIKKKR